MTTTSVDVQILGRSFKLSCPADQVTALNNAADDLNKRLQHLKIKSQVTNVEQLITTVALNVCYELAQEKKRNSEYIKDIEARMQLLQKTVEQVLIEKSQSR